jgi:hypothetical protein
MKRLLCLICLLGCEPKRCPEDHRWDCRVNVMCLNDAQWQESLRACIHPCRMVDIPKNEKLAR